MNKNLYRIILNKSLGLLTVVAENVSSKSAQGGTTSNGVSIIESNPNHYLTNTKTIYARLKALAFNSMLAMGAVVTTVSLASISSTASAAADPAVQGKIVADPTAPSTQQATVLNASNSVLQVNIQTPNAAGVSRNTYQQFDVGSNGAVLNNSRVDTNTQLAGWIQANPWLAKGEARVILNEVNSNNPSYLRGYMEVAGGKAQVVVANPSGISCEGCGFINASRATLTTGTPLFGLGGNLEAYRVTGGQINVAGLGLTAADTSYIDIIARALNINAGIWAKTLNVSLGINTVAVDYNKDPADSTQSQVVNKLDGTQAINSPNNETLPQQGLALDVASLGGMYAGKITLVGTEAGLGVRNAGNIGASAGDVVISADGRLSNSGKIGASVNTQINSHSTLSPAVGGISNTGTISATRELLINADRTTNAGGATDINNAGGTLTAARLDLQAGSLDNTGGKIIQTGIAGLALNSGGLSNDQGGLIGYAPVDSGSSGGSTPTPPTDPTNPTTPTTPTTPTDPSNPTAPTDPTTPTTPEVLADGVLAVDGLLNNNAGQITAGGGTSLVSTHGLNNAGGTLNLKTLDVLGDANDTFNNTSGVISSINGVNVATGLITNQSGKISATDINMQSHNPATSTATTPPNAGISFNNSNGQINASNTLTLNSAGLLNNTNGVLAANAATQITTGSLDNTSGQIISSNSTLDINSAGLLSNSAGTLQAAGNVTLKAQAISNDAGKILTGSNLSLSSQTDTRNLNQGKMAANAAVNLNTGTLSNNTNSSISAGTTLDITATSGDINNNQGTLIANDALQVTGAGNLHNSQGNIQSLNSHVTLNLSQDANNGVDKATAGSISGKADLTINALNINNAGDMYAGANTHLTAAGGNNSSISNSGSIAARGNTQLAAIGSDSLINSTGSLVAGLNADGSLVAPASGIDAGDLILTATKEVTATGQNIAVQTLTVSSNAVDLSGSQTQANRIDLTANTGNINLSKATVKAQQTFTATANTATTQTLITDSGHLTADVLAVNISNLSNAAGEIVHTNVADLTLLAASKAGVKGTINNNQGHISSSSKNLTLTAQDIQNQAGVIDHSWANTGADAAVSDGVLTITADSLAGQAGQINTNGALNINVAGAADLSDGKTNAAAITIHAGSLNHQAGVMIASGATSTNLATNTTTATPPTQITVDGALNNNAGFIGSNANTVITAGSLSNQAGTVQSAGLNGAQSSLNITTHSGQGTTGNIDNSQQGKLLGSGDVILNASGNLDNTSGVINSGKTMTALVAGEINNSAGNMVATEDVTATAASFQNYLGKVASKTKALTVTTTGTTNNSNGEMAAATIAAFKNAGLVNTSGGKISAASISIDTQQNTLDNSTGAISAADNLTVTSGTLINDAGLIQTTANNSSLSINTNGQTLTNTNSGATGGISSQGTLGLMTGDVNNSAGFMGANGNITLNSAAINNSNAGQISSSSNVTLTGTTLNNSTGTIQTGTGDINATLTGDVTNDAGLIRAGNKVTLSTTGLLTNSNTNITDKGIQGVDVDVTATTVNNQSGSLIAEHTLNVLAQTEVQNQSGLISGGTVNITDKNVPLGQPKALILTNTGGTLIAGQALNINTHSAGLDGKMLSQGDLSLNVDTDLAFTAANTSPNSLNANHDLTITTQGNITNSGVLNAGNTLKVSANNIDNQFTGEMNARTTDVTAAQTLTNRGLIDSNGGETVIHSDLLDNVGTGRIYGDHIAIQANILNNREELNADGTTTAAVIASRGDLDIGVGTLTNQEHALLFSGADMRIAGSLDGNNQADITSAGQATAIYNKSANIESTGNMWLTANTFKNSNEHFSTSINVVDTQHIKNYEIIDGSNAGMIFTDADGSWVRDGDGGDDQTNAYFLTNSGQKIYGETWYIRTYDQITSQTEVTTSDPAKILAGGDLKLTGSNLVNDNSQILVGGTLTVDGGSLKNDPVLGQKLIHLDGNVLRSYHKKSNYDGGKHQRRFEDNPGNPYIQDLPTQEIPLPVSIVLTNTKPSTSNSKPASSAITGVAQNTTGTGAAKGGASNGQIIEVTSLVLVIDPKTGKMVAAGTGTNANTAASAPDASGGSSQTATQASKPATVRTSQPNITIPNNALFKANPNDPNKPLIETDPRFASYKNWLSSDYMLQQYNIDPSHVQKRLGDGFYEQKLIREQIAQLTGRRFLDGYSSDQEEYKALMDNGLTYAKAFNLTVGVALTPAQMAQLTSDIVWMVEQTVTLADGTTQQVLVPQVYVRTKPSDLKGDGSLISADSIDLHLTGDFNNSGTIAGRNVVQIDADNVNNLGGRIMGGATVVHANNDVNVVGGTIEADRYLNVTAGHDVNVTTTSSSHGESGLSSYEHTGIDRVAGLYVNNPSGTLNVYAGHDVVLTAAQIANAGKGGTSISAGNDILLKTVKTSDQENLVADADNYLKQGHSEDNGTSISSAGNIILDAGHKIDATAATINSTSGDVTVHAVNDITFNAGERSSNYSSATKTTDSGLLGKTTRTSRVNDTFNGVVGNGVNAAGNLTVISDKGDITATDTQFKAGGDARLDATKGNVNLLAVKETRSHSLETGKETSYDYKNHQEGFIKETAAGSSVSAGGNVTINADKDIHVTASDVSAGDTIRFGDNVMVKGADGKLHTANGGAAPDHIVIDTMALDNQSWNETQKGYKGPVKELIKVAAIATSYLAPTIAGKLSITTAEQNGTREASTTQANSHLTADKLIMSAEHEIHATSADITAKQGYIAADHVLFDAAETSKSQTVVNGKETVTGLTRGVKDGGYQLGGVRITDTQNQTTTTTTGHKTGNISIGDMTMLTDNGARLLGQSLTVNNQYIDMGKGKLVEGGYVDKTTTDQTSKTETLDVTYGVRHAAVDTAIAVNNEVKAVESLKAAKDDYSQAQRDYAAGKITSDALNEYKVNLAAATANVVQAQIATASAAASISASSATLGFKASGTVTHTATDTTDHTNDQTWTGTTHTVAGNSTIVSDDGKGTIDLTGSTFKVKGNAYYDVAGVNAQAVELTHTSSSTSKTNSQTATLDTGGNASGSVSTQASKSQTTQTSHIGSDVDLGNVTGKLGNVRSIGSDVHLTVDDPTQVSITNMAVESLQDKTNSTNSSKGGSIGGGSSSASASYNQSKGYEDTLKTNHVASITIGGNADLNAMGVTNVTNIGGVVANGTRTVDPDTGKVTFTDQGNLNYTGELDLRDLKDHSYKDQKGMSVGVSISDSQTKDKTTGDSKDVVGGSTTLGMTHTGRETESTALATIGKGNVAGAGSANRDVSNTTIVTRDQVTGALNANVTVDNRLLTKDGREQMVDEQKNLGKNLINTGKITAAGIQSATAAVGGLVTGDQTVSQAVDTLLNPARAAQFINDHPDQAAVLKAYQEGNYDGLPKTKEGLQQLANYLKVSVDVLLNNIGIKGITDHTLVSIDTGTDNRADTVKKLGHEIAHNQSVSSELRANMVGSSIDMAVDVQTAAMNTAIAMYEAQLGDGKDAATQTANTQLLKQDNTQLATAIMTHPDQMENWGSVGHQSTTSAMAWAAGLDADVAKKIGESAWAPDRDERNAMSTTSLLNAFDPKAPQQHTHLLDGATKEEALAAQQKGNADYKEILTHIKGLGDDKVAQMTYLDLPEVQEKLHSFGDAYAHINENSMLGEDGAHYQPMYGHAVDSLTKADPDSPYRHPTAYTNYANAVYKATREVLGDTMPAHAELDTVDDAINKVTEVKIKDADEAAEKQRDILRTRLPNIPAAVVPKPLPEWGFIGLDHDKAIKEGIINPDGTPGPNYQPLPSKP